jgi:hypothetical protein
MPEAPKTVQSMSEAAEAFLASLSAEQLATATFDFTNEDERRHFDYTPAVRRGLPLVEMSPPQQRLAHRLVATGLSRGGYATASTIMGLENILDLLEGWQGWVEYPGFEGRPSRGRDPSVYFVSIFGEPSKREPWGWRFEGHHVSLHYTIAAGRIVAPTPTFFGSNPAEAPLGGSTTLRPLAGEEDLGRELVSMLDEEQRARAVLSPVAPWDIVQSNRPRVEEGALPLAGGRGMARLRERLGLTEEHLEPLRYTATPKGLAGAAMTVDQREVLGELVRQYIGRMPDEIAEVEATRLTGTALEALHFAWAGAFERRQPHYYRLQGPRFLVEYDNTQDGANHIHSVWRDPVGDFGADVLTQHYAAAH